MGTRADFYVGIGPTAEWIGSISFDGYPDGAPESVVASTSERGFRAEVEGLLGGDALGTRPDEGWPWPWDDSRTTDYAYAWTADGVRLSCFGHQWQTLAEHEQENEGDDGRESIKLRSDEVVDMAARRNADIVMAKSGLLVVSVPTEES